MTAPRVPSTGLLLVTRGRETRVIRAPERCHAPCDFMLAVAQGRYRDVSIVSRDDGRRFLVAGTPGAVGGRVVYELHGPWTGYLMERIA